MDALRRMMVWHDINHDAEYIILAEMVTSRPFRSLRVLAKDMTILRVVKLSVKFVRNLDLTKLTVLDGVTREVDIRHIICSYKYIPKPSNLQQGLFQRNYMSQMTILLGIQ